VPVASYKPRKAAGDPQVMVDSSGLLTFFSRTSSPFFLSLFFLRWVRSSFPIDIFFLLLAAPLDDETAVNFQ